MITGDIALSDALVTCLRRFVNSFDESWIITHDTTHGITHGNSACKTKEPCFPEYGNHHGDYYERILEPDNHIFTEICMCVCGSFAMQIEENIVDIEEGKACLLLPGVFHCELPKKNSNYLAVWLSINHGTVALHLSGKKENGGPFYTVDGCTIKTALDCNLVINNIRDEINKRSLYFFEVIKLNIIKMLIFILREIDAPDTPNKENRPWKETVVADIQNYIYRNYGRTIRLSDISQEFCISPNYINSIFKSVTGKTIIRYVEEFRIQKARQLLEEPGRTISSVAFELGYYDQYHFSKIFKKETGFTPTQFRKRRK